MRSPLLLTVEPRRNGSRALDALLPLVATLLSGHSDVAIGSRLAPGARGVRGSKREVISRSYNLLLKAAVDDPDSRVDVVSTAREDLKGVWRMLRSSMSRSVCLKLAALSGRRGPLIGQHLRR